MDPIFDLTEEHCAILAAFFLPDSAIRVALEKPGETELSSWEDANELESIARRECPGAASIIRRDRFTRDLWQEKYAKYYAHWS